MAYKELLEKTEEELQKLLGDKRNDLHRLRRAVRAMQEKDVRKIREVRKEISHLLTALTDKKRAPKATDETSRKDQ